MYKRQSLYCYGVDFNKNVSEVFDAQGTIASAYDYSPYGAVTGTGAPFKTLVLSLSADGQFAVTEQTPARQPYAVTWWKNGLAWNMRRLSLIHISLR